MQRITNDLMTTIKYRLDNQLIEVEARIRELDTQKVEAEALQQKLVEQVQALGTDLGVF